MLNRNPQHRFSVVFQGLAGLLRGDFLRAKPEGNPEEEPEENPVHPDYFTWIYILFKIGHFGNILDFFKIVV